jgi:hypothetical protein
MNLFSICDFRLGIYLSICDLRLGDIARDSKIVEFQKNLAFYNLKFTKLRRST